MKKLIVLLALFGCGGGSESASSASTEVTQCGDFNVDLAEVPEIVEAAESSGVEVADSAVDEVTQEANPGLDQGQALKVSGVTIAACGGTVIANDSQDNDNVTQASRLKRLIASGSIKLIEVK